MGESVPTEHAESSVVGLPAHSAAEEELMQFWDLNFGHSASH